MRERELTRDVVIANANGLHARPAAQLVTVARRFTADIRLFCEGRDADGKSIVSLLTLAAACGRRVRVSARGADAAAALDAVCRFVESGLGDDFEEA